MADRFFYPDLPPGGRVTLEGDEAHHLVRVRRLGPGDQVELFDGRGGALAARVGQIGRGTVELTLVGEPLPDRAAPCELTLATAAPKGDRFDWLVEKATELGVTRLVWLRTERSVVDPRSAKLDRLRRAIVEAAKQCGRNRLMRLDGPVPWADLLRDPTAPVRLFAHPGGLPASAWPRAGTDRPAILAVGPEGGFSDREVEAARGAGWQAVDLGRTILRVETAAVVGSALILAGSEGERA